MMLQNGSVEGGITMPNKVTQAPKAAATIETIKSRVAERVGAANLSRNEASRRAGLGLSYVNDLLSGKTKNPSRESLAKLGTVVNADVDYFFGLQDEPRTTGEMSGGVPAYMSGSVSLYYVGLSDADGFFKLSESQKDLVTFPFPSGSDSYCVSMPDDTMTPRYKAGEAVMVSRKMPVSAGGAAVIKRADGRVAIREIVTINPDKITVKALNGDVVSDIPRSDVTDLHRVVGTCELR